MIQQTIANSLETNKKKFKILAIQEIYKNHKMETVELKN